MASFKIVISDPKTGKSYQREVKDKAADSIIGLKIGDTVKGDQLDLAGYEFELTGGSDDCGFPMRKDVIGLRRKSVLITKGFGLRKAARGIRLRRTVAGNAVHEKTAQVNLKITKHGAAKLEAEGEKKEEAPAEKPKEKKPEAKEEKKAHKEGAKEKPKEDKK